MESEKSKRALKSSRRSAFIKFLIGYLIVMSGFLYHASESNGLVNVENRPQEMEPIIVFLVLFGILFFISGFKTVNRMYRFKRYMNLIAKRNMTSVRQIANTTGKSIRFVTKDIKKMIDKNYFDTVSWDLNRGEIVNGHNFQTNVSSSTQPLQEQAQKVRMEVVQCSGCGAKNSVEVGQVTRCEFCDTPLSA